MKKEMAIIIVCAILATIVATRQLEVTPPTQIRQLTGTIVSTKCPISDVNVVALKLSDGTLCYLTDSAGMYLPVEPFTRYLGKTVTLRGETYTANGYLHMKNFKLVEVFG